MYTIYIYIHTSYMYSLFQMCILFHGSSQINQYDITTCRDWLGLSDSGYMKCETLTQTKKHYICFHKSTWSCFYVFMYLCCYSIRLWRIVTSVGRGV